MTNETTASKPSDIETVKSKLAELLPGKVLEWSEFRGQTRVVCQAGDILKCLNAFKSVGFDQLTDLTAVDLLEYGNVNDRCEVGDGGGDGDAEHGFDVGCVEGSFVFVDEYDGVGSGCDGGASEGEVAGSGDE